MKKILSVFLAVVMLFSVLALAGCKEKEEPGEEDAVDGEIDSTSADYESDNLFVPINLEPGEEDAVDGEIDIVPKEITEIAEDSAAYYKDGNLFIPINLAIKYNTYTVKSDKYTWYVRYSIGIVINHPFDMKEVTVECKNNIVTIPEKYANENYFLKTRCNNVAVFILVTQKPNSGYIPEPEPDYPIIIR